MLAGLWDRLIESVSRRMPATAVDSWVRPCRLVALEGDHLRVSAPNDFSRDWLLQRYMPALEAAAAECLGGRPRVSVVADDAGDLDDLEGPPAPAAPGARPHPTLEMLNPRYTFDTFVVGAGNQFAQAASQAVAELPSRAYNPLFLYGGVGLGKTHLLHAVGHQTAKPHDAAHGEELVGG
jgi:chromosomal replication initiator protein